MERTRTRSGGTGASRQQLDRGKVRAALRRLDRETLLVLLDRAIDQLAGRRLEALVEGHLPRESLLSGPDLVSEVQRFHEASRRGDYYESFDVNSKNYLQRSRGTQAWIAECERLFDRCTAESARNPPEVTRRALELLRGLLRHVDEGHDDVVFWADEGGAYEVGVDWKRVLPVWFQSLAKTAQPEEYAREVRGLVEEFVHFNPAPFLREAQRLAMPAQRKALRHPAP